MSTPVSVAVVGASGYTGAELLRLLLGHPRVRLAGLYAKTSAGQPLANVFPQFAGVLPQSLDAFDADAVAREARVAFCALPHGQSAETVAALVERGVTVLDLSADFRLRSAAEYESWYGGAHPAPALLESAVYGLPELHRKDLPGASLVAVPGCYPTGAILALAPLLETRLVLSEDLIIDSKSGASGAGRSPSQATHLPEAAEGVRAYKVAGTHRHTPEMEQELALAAGTPVRVTFTPHLLPMSRGILTCAYALPADAARRGQVYYKALCDRYRGEPFVTVLPPGQLPDTAFVRGSNRAHVSVAVDERAGRVLALSAIDNLVKGAAGQAVQAMNCVLGWPEETGLEGVAFFP